jgi:hypothetical protein
MPYGVMSCDEETKQHGVVSCYCRPYKTSASNGIINITGLINDLKLLCALDIIDDEAFKSKLGIFTACAIEFEGISGDNTGPEGSKHRGSCFLTGDGYEMSKIQSGVKCLGKILSQGVGMNSYHAVGFYVSFGHNLFVKLMKDVFKISDDGLSMAGMA